MDEPIGGVLVGLILIVLATLVIGGACCSWQDGLAVEGVVMVVAD